MIKTPIELIKHKNLTQPARNAYYSSLEINQQQSLLAYYQSLTNPSTREKNVLTAITKKYNIFMSNGKLDTDIYLNVKKAIGVCLYIKIEPTKNINDYFNEELQDVLDYSKLMKFINLLPKHLVPSFIQEINGTVIQKRNAEVEKLHSVITINKNDVTSTLRQRYDKAIKLIQEVQRDEGMKSVDNITSFDDIIINNKKIIPQDVRTNYERDVAEYFVKMLAVHSVDNSNNFKLSDVDDVGELGLLYSQLFYDELKRNDSFPIGV